MPKSLRKLANWVKGKIPFLRKSKDKSAREPGDEVSVKPLLAYFVVNHMDEQNWPVTRENLQNAFRAATRSLQTSGFVQKGSHQPTELGKRAMKVMQDRRDYWKAQDRYGEMLDDVRDGAPRRYRESADQDGWLPLLTEADIHPKSTMLAVYPPRHVAKQIAKYADPKTPLNDLHITVFYFGQVAEQDLSKIESALQSLAGQLKPCDISLAGSGCFWNDDAAVRNFLMDSAELERNRMKIVNKLSEHDIEPGSEYGWLPHVTLEYHDDQELPTRWEQDAKNGIPSWRADTLWLVRGNSKKMAIPMKGD